MFRALAYLEALEVPVWVRRPGAVFPGAGESAVPENPPPPVAVEAPAPADTLAAPPPRLAASTRPAPPADAPRAPSPPRGDWDGLAAQVKDCTACPLHKTRTQSVFGVGDRQAEWMIIGEAPGQDEDLQGEPFVGRAGQLLNAMLEAIGLRREAVYIANVVKCRPPGNRNPGPEEMACCGPFLERQIALLRPRLILSVGRVSANYLLQLDAPIGGLRGTRHVFRDSGIPLVVTYHPAYLLRRPLEKRKAWQDLQMARRILAESG